MTTGLRRSLPALPRSGSLFSVSNAIAAPCGLSSSKVRRTRAPLGGRRLGLDGLPPRLLQYEEVDFLPLLLQLEAVAAVGLAQHLGQLLGARFGPRHRCLQ